MKILTKYTAFLYIKYFFIVFIALELFYVGIDTLTNIKNLPTSTNIFILHIALTFVIASSYLLPISLIFALIIMKFNMIRNNELISFYALGISKNRLIIAPFFICILITLIFIGLNFTDFAYANNYKKNLDNFSKNSDSIFLKYNDNFIFINFINQTDKSAENIEIFEIKDGNLTKKINSLSGKFEENFWNLKDTETFKFDTNLTLGNQIFTKTYDKSQKNLQGFYPQVLEKVSDSSRTYSISDAIKTIKIFNKINTSPIKTSLYTMIFFPFFAPFMVLILYYFLPTTSRFGSLALKSFAFFTISLLLWGFLFILIKFSQNGILNPEISVIFPILLLGCYSFYLFLRNR